MESVLSRKVCILGGICLLFTNVAAMAAGFNRTADFIRTGFEKGREFLWLADDIYGDKITYWHCCVEKEPGSTLDPVARRRIASGTMYFADHLISNYSQTLVRFLATGDTVVALTHETGTYLDRTMLDQYVEYFFTIQFGKITRIEYWAVEQTPTPPRATEQRNKYGEALHNAIAAAAEAGYTQIERKATSPKL
jgi:hypothetical protein